MAKPKPNPEREEFHQRVNCLWNDLVGEEVNDTDREVVVLLGQLLVGMDKLAIGEVPEIFRPGPMNPRAKKATEKTTPSAVLEKRACAVFYVEFLRRHRKTMKMLIPEAIDHVAKAFGIKPDILASWRKVIMSKNNNTSWVLQARRGIEERILVARSQKPTLTKVLERAVAEGKHFKSVGS